MSQILGRDVVVWPEWLLSEFKEIQPQLQSVSILALEYFEAVKCGHSYQLVMQSDITAISDKLISDGYITADGRILRQPQSLPKWYEAAQINDIGKVIVTIDAMIAVKKTALVYLIKTASECLTYGNLLVAYICFRSIIEQIAHLSIINKMLTNIEEPKNYNDARKTLFDTYGKLAKFVYATRVDWSHLASEEADSLLNRKKIPYKRKENRMSIEADSILDGVDELSKKVKGIRQIYEILCEFAHPNVGVTISLTKSMNVVHDKFGFRWIRKEIGFGAPLSSIKEMRILHEKILSKVSESFVLSKQLLNDIDNSKEKMRHITQVLYNHVLQNRKDLIDIYSLCPCQSGRKIKFCCGATRTKQ